MDLRDCNFTCTRSDAIQEPNRGQVKREVVAPSLELPSPRRLCLKFPTIYDTTPRHREVHFWAMPRFAFSPRARENQRVVGMGGAAHECERCCSGGAPAENRGRRSAERPKGESPRPRLSAVGLNLAEGQALSTWVHETRQHSVSRQGARRTFVRRAFLYVLRALAEM